MFEIIKTESGHADFFRTVGPLITEIFGPQESDFERQDKIWKEWLSLKVQGRTNLLELLKSTSRDVFKARAIAILIVPIGWHDQITCDYNSETNNFCLKDNAHDYFTKFSPRLLNFTIELIKQSIGIVLAPNADKYLRRNIFRYNRFILQIIAILSETDPRAKELFDLYQIGDHVPKLEYECGPSIEPFREMLESDAPEVWKRLTDTNVRDVVVGKLNGYLQTGRPENAFHVYLMDIYHLLSLEKLTYSTNLLASQIEFIIGPPSPHGSAHFSLSQTMSILDKLKGRNYTNIRLRVAQHLVFTSQDWCRRYEIGDDSTTIKMIERLRKEFGRLDEKLDTYLSRTIDAFKARMSEARNVEIERAMRKETLLSKMR